MPSQDSNKSGQHGRVGTFEQSGSSAAEKRRRLDDDYLSVSSLRDPDSLQPKKQLSHADYTVAWICALPVELKAATLMLDEEHMSLPVASNDNNVYILGSIAGHNIAITSLRAGVYGFISATATGKDMISTFPNITSVPLLVGVGGGVPSPTNDIRLGDVVVSRPTSELPAVKQYDSGKIGLNGQLEIKGSNNKPAPVLLSAVANLEARHDSIGRRIRDHISQASQKYDIDIEYPRIDLDILYEQECEHTFNDSVCNICGPLNPIEREPRHSSDPMVYFGPIASGNQVIKHARTRNRLAEAHGFLCFEMEAAGLMDFLPCLVVRGISDYCDSFKHKEFQSYAALTAAAFAKELLSILPRKRIEPGLINESLNNVKLEHRKLVMEALDFVEADNRRATIKQAHLQTCQWLFRQQEYANWRHGKVTKDSSLLWIKGNPGSGKSTIMKFILEDVEKHKSKGDVVVSFFFNARGDYLERSIGGLYRSLIFQLLMELPDLQYLLDRIRLPANEKSYALEYLIRLFRSIVQAIHNRQLICLIDGLDECPEEEVRQMVDRFVDLVSALANDKELRILFSSRHYPNISIDVGQQFVLEKQDGHADDLVKYIQASLKIGTTKQAEKLKQDIFDKANGIFLWVVLVVRILKREYDQGRVYGMDRRLKELPTELNELFKDILLRDNNNLTELVLCIQWILFSRRPLKREEFYFAVLIGNDAIDVIQLHQEEITVEIMNNFVLDCSKGLAEITRGKKPVVQFIHESVGEFLQTPGALPSLWNGFRAITRADGHTRLRDCCNRLLSSTVLDGLNPPDELVIASKYKSTEPRKTATTTFPLLEYAASSVLYHSNEAQRTGENQLHFLRAFNGNRWLELYKVIQTRPKLRLIKFPTSILQYLALENLQQLFKDWLEVCPPDEESMRAFLEKCVESKKLESGKAVVRQYTQNLYSKAGHIDLSHFDILFDLLIDLCTYPSPSRREAFSVVLQVICCWHQEKTATIIQRALESAALMKRSKALKTLLDVQSDSSTNLEPGYIMYLLEQVFEEPGSQRLTINGNNIILKTQAPLDAEAKACIEILVGRGARLEDVEDPGRAIYWAEMDLVQFLVNHGSRWFVHSRDIIGRTPLYEALFQGRGTDLIEFLIHQGSDVNAKDSDGATPLSYCLIECLQKFEYAQLLVNHGAKLPVDQQTRKACSPDVQARLERIRAMKPDKPCCKLGKAVRQQHEN